MRRNPSAGWWILIPLLVVGVALGDTLLKNRGVSLGPITTIDCTGPTCTRLGSTGYIGSGDGGYGSVVTTCDAGSADFIGISLTGGSSPAVCTPVAACAALCGESCSAGSYATGTNGSGGLVCSSATPSGDTCSGASCTITADSTFHGIIVGRGSSNDSQTVLVATDNMPLNDGGIRNTGIGHGVFANLSSGNDNVCVGDLACNAMNTGGDNTGIGTQSLLSCTNCSQNTVVGLFAMRNAVSAGHNTCMGDDCCMEGVNSESNTCMGLACLRDNQGDNNTSMGRYAAILRGNYHDNSDFGTFVAEQHKGNRGSHFGYQSMYCYAEDGGDSLCSGADDNAGFGWESGRWMRTGKRNVMIGSNSGVGVSPLTDSTGAVVNDNDGVLIGYGACKSVPQTTTLNHFGCVGSECRVCTSGTYVLGRPDGGDVVVVGACGDDGSGNRFQVTGGIHSNGHVVVASGSSSTTINGGNYVQMIGTQPYLWLIDDGAHPAQISLDPDFDRWLYDNGSGFVSTGTLAASNLSGTNTGDQTKSCLAGSFISAVAAGTGSTCTAATVYGPTNASYITRVSESGLSNETAMGGLATGLVLNTTTTGTPTIYGGTGTCATSNYLIALNASGAGACQQPAFTDISGTATSTQVPLSQTATALASNPSDCSSGTYATTIAASGNLGCAAVPFSDLSGTASSSQVPLAQTATALAANPTDCAAGNFANAIAASGNLTCATAVTSVSSGDGISVATGTSTAVVSCLGASTTDIGCNTLPPDCVGANVLHFTHAGGWTCDSCAGVCN